MKKIIIPLSVISLVLITFVIAMVWWSRAIAPPLKDINKTNFLITKGMSASQIGIKLQENGFIKNSTAFKIYTQVTGKSQNIQAGEYLLSKNLTLYQLVDELVKGPTQIWVTIPEGFRREQVAIRFANLLGKEGKQKDNFIQEFLKLTEEKEGFLFPDTYLVAKDITVAKIVSAMESTFVKMTLTLENKINRSSLTEVQIITIASLIERETKNEKERPGVSGVIYNRLEYNWPLQVDAAVQYAVASAKTKEKTTFDDNLEFWVNLTKSDLEMNSPYNTYKNAGLPPGPIANPGLSSITAAVNPESHEYFFYLHDLNGDIHYAKTLEEHNFNVRKYLGK